MAKMEKYGTGPVVMGRLDHGADLLEEITEICRKEGIRMGRVAAIGAVSGARLGFYNQETREYRFFSIDQPLEILNLAGNISIKDGEPMVHAHVVLGDKDGKAFGGHLAPGTTVFACECIIGVLEGPVLERKLDSETGLPLWDM
ncbi:MAG: DNA-binding protein [Desulfosalsimonadaceae bacterium]